MDQQQVTVQRVAWRELFPCCILFQTLPVAASFTVWSLAFIGVLATPLGWLLLEVVFVSAESDKNFPSFIAAVEANRSPYLGILDGRASVDVGADRLVGPFGFGPLAAFGKLTEPFRQLLIPQGSWRHTLYWMFGGLWTLALWSFIGCAIARTTLVRMARDEVLGIDEAFEFAFHHARSALVALTVPLMVVAILTVPGWIVGWLMRSDVGLALVGVFWVPMLLLAIGLMFVIVGWYVGWPLMVAALVADRISAIDAMTRVYSLIYQRPLNFVLYVVVALLFGSLLWLGVSTLAAGTTYMAHWTTSWTAGERFAETLSNPAVGMLDLTDANADSTGESFWARMGKSAIRFWDGGISSLAVAFLFGHLWVLAAAIFLLMRRDVDQVELDEVYIPEDEQAYPLPPLVTDDRGIPTIQPLKEGTPGSEPQSSG